MRRISAIALPVAVLALAGCGSSSNTTANSTPAASTPASSASTPSSSTSSSSGAMVGMSGLKFSPTALHAKVGDTITFTNNDTPPHNVTYVSGPKFTSSGTLNPGDKFTLKLTQAGTIAYFCTIHPFMKATIVVSP